MKTRRLIEILCYGFLTSAAIGCAGQLAETRHGQAAGEWSVRLPSTPSTFGKLAFGTGGNAQPALAVQQELPTLLAVKRPAPTKHDANHVKRISAPAAAPMAIASAQPEPTAAMAQPAAPTLIASNEPNAEQRYAQRETQDRKLQTFRGGDAIIISASALVIVLLIVLLVLLLR